MKKKYITPDSIVIEMKPVSLLTASTLRYSDDYADENYEVL